MNKYVEVFHVIDENKIYHHGNVEGYEQALEAAYKLNLPKFDITKTFVRDYREDMYIRIKGVHNEKELVKLVGDLSLNLARIVWEEAILFPHHLFSEVIKVIINYKQLIKTHRL